MLDEITDFEEEFEYQCDELYEGTLGDNSNHYRMDLFAQIRRSCGRWRVSTLLRPRQSAPNGSEYFAKIIHELVIIN